MTHAQNSDIDQVTITIPSDVASSIVSTLYINLFRIEEQLNKAREAQDAEGVEYWEADLKIAIHVRDTFKKAAFQGASK